MLPCFHNQKDDLLSCACVRRGLVEWNGNRKCVLYECLVGRRAELWRALWPLTWSGRLTLFLLALALIPPWRSGSVLTLNSVEIEPCDGCCWTWSLDRFICQRLLFKNCWSLYDLYYDARCRPRTCDTFLKLNAGGYIYKVLKLS